MKEMFSLGNHSQPMCYHILISSNGQAEISVLGRFYMLHWPSVTFYSLCTQNRLDSGADFYSLKDGFYFFSPLPYF